MDNNKDIRKRRFRYRGSLVGPIILIIIGVVFLLNNIGNLSGDVWDIILKLWPLILVAIGLDIVLQGRGVTGPLLFIGIGIVILLSNFGLIDWNIWEILLKLWPIILIAFGLDIVIGRRSLWGAILAVGILVIILIGALWYFGPGQVAVANEGMEIIQPLNNANRAEVIINPAIAEVRIGSLSSSANLVEATVYQWRGETVQSDYVVVDGKGEFSLRSEGISNFQSPQSTEAGWNLDLIDNIPLTLDFGLGAGKLEVDMQSLMVDEFNIRVAVGKIVLILPRQGQVNGEIENPIGSIHIHVPKNTGLRIEAETGLTDIRVPANYASGEGSYTSPGYALAENQVDLIINQAIGLVRVEEVGD